MPIAPETICRVVLRRFGHCRADPDKSLRAFGHLAEQGLESGMIKSGAAVKQQKRRERAHRWPVRPQFRTVDVEEQPYVIDSDVHE
jgi:hypothetical protein